MSVTPTPGPIATTVVSSTSTEDDTSSTATFPPFTESTNLGPLPTTSFPSNCLETLWDMNTAGMGIPYTYNTQGCAIKTCCPDENRYTEDWAWMTSYYSPGVCPEQYRSCPPPEGTAELATSQGESIAFCCPTNYVCPYSAAGFVCKSLLTTSTTVVMLDNVFNQESTSMRPETIDPGDKGVSQLAYPIQIRFRKGETPTATATATSGTASSTPTNTDAGEPGPSKALSTGAIVGIALGAFATVIICLSLFLFYRYKTKKGKAALQPAPVAPMASPNQNNDMYGGHSFFQPNKQELSQPSELPAEGANASPVAELPANHDR
ncbi:hypothetical protein FQN55_004141 [Onygenales sp. PD_40]|nr:hypothetical protein FQN55_004141 [Onygenales sp. PD_40]KAK2786630.1 hypothetical protein FQN53_006334 [Emmonsiellopsis sp. PD_33]